MSHRVVLIGHVFEHGNHLMRGQPRSALGATSASGGVAKGRGTSAGTFGNATAAVVVAKAEIFHHF